MLHVPSLTHLHKKLTVVDTNYKDIPDVLQGVIIADAAVLEVRFIPGTANVRFLTVPMEHHPNPTIYDIRLSSMKLRPVPKAVLEWQASPIIRNAAFKMIDEDHVVARSIRTRRVRVDGLPEWGVSMMEISLDPTAPTVFPIRVKKWNDIPATLWNDVVKEGDTLHAPLDSFIWGPLMMYPPHHNEELRVDGFRLKMRLLFQGDSLIHAPPAAVFVAAHLEESKNTDM